MIKGTKGTNLIPYYFKHHSPLNNGRMQIVYWLEMFISGDVRAISEMSQTEHKTKNLPRTILDSNITATSDNNTQISRLQTI